MKSSVFLLILFLPLIHLQSYAQPGPDEAAINKTDNQGHKQGVWKKTSANGQLIYTGYFADDKPEGHFVYYDTTGAVKAESDFSDQGAKAYTTAFYRNGTKLSEGLYVNEKRDGVWKYYNEDGILISEENYRNGIPEGVWKTYYANGALLEELNYRNGIKEGPWKQYYFDGPVKVNAVYKNGKLEGLATFYHPNGRVMVSGPYVNNLKDGVWMHISDKGVAEKREVWSNGFLSAEEYYDKDREREVKEEK